MKLPALTRRSARLILPAVALLTCAGGTAAVAAPITGGQAPGQVHGAPAKFVWHSLTLKNGWMSASTAKLNSGTPGWALHSGVIYLRGVVKQPNPKASATFADLPKSVNPSRNLYLQADTSGSVAGVLFIGRGGALQAYQGNADTSTSLGGISYPTSTIAAHQLTTQNTWVSADPIYQTGNPSYAISHGIVYLSGSLFSTTSPPPVTLVFMLPKAAWPSHDLYLTAYTFGGSTGFVEILSTGQVDVSGADAGQYTSLAGISFPTTAAAWHKFQLENNWHSSSAGLDAGAPAYTSINGVVYLAGAMSQSPAGKLIWTNLPAATRTAHVVKIPVETDNPTIGVVQLSPSQGHLGGSPVSGAQSFTSLGGIAYPPSS